MDEVMKCMKEHDRKVRLLYDYLNSMCDDNSIVYNVDYKKIKTDGDPVMGIRYQVELHMTEDELDELIKKLES